MQSRQATSNPSNKNFLGHDLSDHTYKWHFGFQQDFNIAGAQALVKRGGQFIQFLCFARCEVDAVQPRGAFYAKPFVLMS